MGLITSSDFASVSAQGKDWREASKKILEQLETVRSKKNEYNFGFLYVSDALSDDIGSILNLFKSVLDIEHWVGTMVFSVIGGGDVFGKTPSIAAMVCNFPEDSFCLIEPDEESGMMEMPHEWMRVNMPVVSLVHGMPSEVDILQSELDILEQQTNSFLIGGVGFHANKFVNVEGGPSLESILMLSDEISISTMVAQGVKPVGPSHIITKSDDNVILEIDNKPALEVFQKDLRILAAEKLRKTPEEFIIELQNVQSSDQVPPEFKSLFQGEVHIALPISQSDQKDYLVRDIVHIDMDEGSITISENINKGERLLLVERSPETVVSDLANSLVRLRKRIQAERNCFEPKAALYISCIERHDKDNGQSDHYEADLIKDVIGDIPLIGFHSAGEIHNARFYNYAGILTLFF